MKRKDIGSPSALATFIGMDRSSVIRTYNGESKVGDRFIAHLLGAFENDLEFHDVFKIRT
ncbi:hypothetical protein M2280_004388 [Prescottella agglutinans]|uniref:XRE family transcriptional regulator n=1 Tax=Prescottella agglutinans TaxID=1644129 RepID=A0ABT6MGZ3_9NOCA|nr:hypothetical protein [Prescottella agglutinans]